MDRLETNDGLLEFDVRGEGRPLVFVHGSVFADPRVPTLRHANLVHDDRVVTYRRRGYGGNSPAQAGRTLADESADIVLPLANSSADLVA